MKRQEYIQQLFNTMVQLKKILESQTQETREEKTATIMQYSALQILKERDNATVGNVASSLSISKSSATQLIERLVKSGFAKRRNDREDRRVVHIIITPSGEEQLLLLKQKFMEKMERVLSKISEEDVKELLRIQTKLIETLQTDPQKSVS